MPTHDTLSGHTITYDADPKLARFMKRVAEASADPNVSEDQLMSLIYGLENPLLGAPMLGLPLGTLTPAAVSSPAYRVMGDLLFRKRVEKRGWDVAKMAAKYTLTIAEASARSGVSEDGLRKAAREGRVPSWVKDGQTFLEPRSLDVLVAERGLGRRGPTRKAV
jgi:hypothetical protein